MHTFKPRDLLIFLLSGCGDDSRESSSEPAGGSATTTVTTATPTTGTPDMASGSGADTSGLTNGASATTTADATTATDDTSTGLEDSTASSTGGPTCEVKLFPNVTSKRPVDLMLYVDASTSLGNVILTVDDTLKNLPNVLTDHAVDYRILIISRWPHACLAPIDCNAASAPMTVSDDGRLLYVHLGTGSSGVPDGYHSFIDSYWNIPYAENETEPFLREDSVRVIFGLTDGEKASNDVAGASAYLPLLDERLGVGHTVHTAGGWTPTGTLLGPMDPLQSGACLGNDDSGPTQKGQQLSILTGGLRMSVCDLDDPALATELFQQIAESATDLGRRNLNHQPRPRRAPGGVARLAARPRSVAPR
jgi:hypothetical protein